jgi:hypothetical protein
MQGFWCQRYGHTQQRCDSSLLCGNCGENGYSEAPSRNAPRCISCTGVHAIQGLRVKGNLSFIGTQKFLESRPEAGNQLHDGQPSWAHSRNEGSTHLNLLQYYNCPKMARGIETYANI